MKDEHAERKKSFDPADYPALREFFPGICTRISARSMARRARL